LQLLLERLVGVDGETGGGDANATAGTKGLLEAIAEETVDVVDEFHERVEVVQASEPVFLRAGGRWSKGIRIS